MSIQENIIEHKVNINLLVPPVSGRKMIPVPTLIGTDQNKRCQVYSMIPLNIPNYTAQNRSRQTQTVWVMFSMNDRLQKKLNEFGELIFDSTNPVRNSNIAAETLLH